MASGGGDVDYERHGHGYARRRRTDPRIAAHVHAALGPGRTVLNVGAGAGSYEPADRHVVAVEPSAVLRAQRSGQLAPAVDATAEDLPFDDAAFDAAMAMVTVHQWADIGRGLAELRRVTRGPVVLLTFDPAALDRWWLADYAPELLAAEAPRYPTMEVLRAGLGGACDVLPVPVPADCVDGFIEAFYARPELLLDPDVRTAQSAWGQLVPSVVDSCVGRLRAALASGDWDARHGEWRTRPRFDGSLRLVLATGSRSAVRRITSDSRR